MKYLYLSPTHNGAGKTSDTFALLPGLPGVRECRRNSPWPLVLPARTISIQEGRLVLASQSSEKNMRQ